jgi:hypothetical protein
MYDSCWTYVFIIKEFAIASETFKDRSSRAAFERTFMNTLDKSEAMRIVLNDANIQCHEQPNNRLCVYLGALVSRCDVQLLDAKEVIDGAVNTSPFQRTVLHGTVDTLRDWLRHAFLPKNAQTGCACTAESVMEATYTVCAGAGHAEYLVQHARVLFNDGFVHEAAQVAAAASTVSTHPYICAEAELEHLLADHGGADPYGIPPSIGELVDEIKSTSNIIPARKIDLLAQIFFDLTLLTQGFEKDKPEYAFTTLTEICTERPYDQVPNALRSMRSWIENFDDSNWSPGELKDLASAFRALPEGFTLPESLWNEVFFNLSEGTPLSSPRTFASLIELLDEIRTYLQRSHIQVSHVQIQGDQTEDTSPLFQRLLTQRETRHAELTLLYGSLVGDHSRYFPSEEQLESARARVQSEQYTSLHIRALHLLTRTASVRQDHRTVFELCTKVFAITNAFSLHGVERAACSRILGEIAFEFVQELLEKQPKTRPTPTSIAQRLQSLQEHREIIEWFVPSPGIPQFLLTTDPKQPPSEPRDLIRIHHRLNSLARNLLIGPVAALLENGTIGAGGIDEIDAEEPMLRRCLKLCGDIF